MVNWQFTISFIGVNFSTPSKGGHCNLIKTWVSVYLSKTRGKLNVIYPNDFACLLQYDMTDIRGWLYRHTMMKSENWGLYVES